MKPIVHGLENEYRDQIEFVYLNIDDPNTRDEREKYNFRYQPHYILIGPDGEIVQEWLGYVEASEFKSTFDDTLSQ